MKTRATIFSVLGVLFLAASLTSGAPGAGTVTPDTADAAHTLSDTQKQEIKRIRSHTEKQAALPALHLARIISEVYKNMLADKPDEKLRAKLSAEMKEVTWQLLVIKGQAIRETVNVLTPAQKQLVKAEMRKPGAPADLSEVITHTFNLTDK
jgi:Spy/CpxP family protein refolding chaperone